MHSRMWILRSAVCGFLGTLVGACVTDQPIQQQVGVPDYQWSGEPHATDDVSTVEAKLRYDKTCNGRDLSLAIEGRPFSISTTWPNQVEPADFRFQSGRKYRVTIIRDNRLHPSMLYGKYATIVPVVSRVETLEGTVIFDGAICPLHKTKAR